MPGDQASLDHAAGPTVGDVVGDGGGVSVAGTVALGPADGGPGDAVLHAARIPASARLLTTETPM